MIRDHRRAVPLLAYPVPVPYTIDSTGGDATWRVATGCVWRTSCKLVDGSTPIDVSTATIVAWVTEKSTPSLSDPLKTFTVTIIDGPAGEWEIEVAEVDADLSPARYWWAMQIDFGGGAEPLASGSFYVEPWVLLP